MATPVPSPELQHAELDALDLHLSEAAPTPLRRALHDILDELSIQIQHGHDAQHDVEYGVEHLVVEAVDRLGEVFGETDRASRVEAAALLIASLELDDYEGAAR